MNLTDIVTDMGNDIVSEESENRSFYNDKASSLSKTIQSCGTSVLYQNSKVFNSWILLKLFCSKVIALFKLTFACSRPFFSRKHSLL